MSHEPQIPGPQQPSPQSPSPQRPAPQAPGDPTLQPTETLHPIQPETAQVPAQGWGAPSSHPAPPSGQGWGAPAAPPSGQGWGQAPAAPGKGRIARLTPVQKGLAAAGIAVVVAGGAGAAVYAASNGSTGAGQGFGNGAPGAAGPNGGPNGTGQNGTGQNGTGQNGSPMGGGFGGPGNLGAGAVGQAVHGEYVVQSGGKYVTELEQSGTVTAVSGGQITVKSADGYVQTYAISSQTTVASFGARGSRQQGQSQSQQSQSQGSASSLATGQTVRVTALKDGNAALTILISPTTGSSGSASSGQSN